MKLGNFLKIFFLLLLGAGCFQVRAMDNNAFVRGFQSMVEEAARFAQEQEIAREAEVVKYEGWLASESPEKKAFATKKLASLDERSKGWDATGRQFLGIGADALKGWHDVQLAQQREAVELKKVQEKAKIEAAGNAYANIERMKLFLAPDNLKRIGLIAGSVIGVSIVSYYGTKLAYEQIAARLGKPVLVRETSKLNFTDYCKQKLLGYVPVKPTMNDIILPEAVGKAVMTLADDTKHAYETGMPFRNLLLYGPPGTGKTMFARIMAYYSEMDYAIMTGADFSQFKPGEDIAQLHKLIQWAKNSENGLIIFIDEADVFLRNRSKLNDQGVKLLNAFLSHTGDESDKFMFVFATNHPEVLDPAVLSRIHKKVYFPLPGQVEREALLNLYVDKKIRKDVRYVMKGKEEIEIRPKISDEISAEFIKQMGTRIDGFAGRDIMQMVGEMAYEVYRSPECMLTPEIFDSVVKQKIEQHKQDLEFIQGGDYSAQIK